jgi:glutaredoxin
MKPSIEVFVRSFSPYVDYELSREMSQHVYCDRELATKAGEMFSQFNKFGRRMFSDEDWAVLQRLVETNGLADGKIKIYDISHAGDRFKALSRGITKTPVIIINGEKRGGLETVLDAIDRHSSKKL